MRVLKFSCWTAAFGLCLCFIGLLCSSTIRADDSLNTTPWRNTDREPGGICEQNSNEIFRWASTGGGWRAMVADMAFANVFRQAGVITGESSLFSSMSAESGGSWFSTQFFYSEQFFTKTALSTPMELYDFVLLWMNAYQSLPLERAPECKLLETVASISAFEQLVDYCNILVDYRGDWAQFVSEMMDITSASYGDPGISSRLINPELRVDAMSQTDLYIQTSLAPNSRVRSKESLHDQVIYIGPENSFEIYSIPLCVQWSVTNEYATYYTNAAPSGTFPTGAQVHEDDTPKGFSFSDWSKFFLFPPPAGSTTQILTPVTSSLTGDFEIPFAGIAPNLAQIAAASSGAAGALSPAVPSTLAQTASAFRYSFQDLNKTEALLAEKALQIGLDLVYKAAVLDDLAVCSQWPSSCGETDGRFIDGFYTDSITAALNIGQYQTKQGGDLSKTIKLVLTQTNVPTDGPAVFLAYFSTLFNQGVMPGGFLWPQNFTSDFPIPVYSYQIFQEYLDMEILERQTETYNGINVTTFSTDATTIDNPAFKTIAGQRVEILFLRLNMDIPTIIFGEREAAQWKEPLAEMAKGIAASSQLVDRVNKFFCNNAL